MTVPRFIHRWLIGHNHPEDWCDRCGGRNIVWLTRNDLWNSMSGGFSILCPICFVELCELSGYKPLWVLSDKNG